MLFKRVNSTSPLIQRDTSAKPEARLYRNGSPGLYGVGSFTFSSLRAMREALAVYNHEGGAETEHEQWNWREGVARYNLGKCRACGRDIFTGDGHFFDAANGYRVTAPSPICVRCMCAHLCKHFGENEQEISERYQALKHNDNIHDSSCLIM